MAKKSKRIEVGETPVMSKADKLRALRAAVSTVSGNSYSKGTISIGSNEEDSKAVQYDSISTGSALVDDIIGVGGLPRGRIVEIFGQESCGKTSLVTLLMAEAQKKYPDDYVAIVDVEHAFDRKYAQRLGMDLDGLVFNQPDSGEEALDYVKSIVASGACSVVALDSVAGLMTQTQLEKGLDEHTMGQVAKLMSEQLREIIKLAKKTNTLVIFINQVRDKIGTTYGNPETTPGGRALKFYASVRLRVARGKAVKKGEMPIGQEFRVKAIKNKVNTPFLECETILYFGEGFDRELEIADLSVSKGIVPRAGAWYTIPLVDNEEGVRVQGKNGIKEYLLQNPEELSRFEDLIFNNEPDVENITEIEE